MKNRKYANKIGSSLIVMAILAGVAYGWAHPQLKIGASNLNTVWIIALIAWTLIYILDLVITKAICNLYSPVNKKWSRITAGLRLIYTMGLGIAIVQLFLAYSLYRNNTITDEYFSYLQNFETIWSISLIVFGLHLISWFVLMGEAKSWGKVWKYLLLIAGLGYVIVHSLHQSSIDKEVLKTIEGVLMLPMTLGELGTGIWLMIKFKRDVI